MASILETKSITKKFGGFTAVDNVSLTVDPGEIRFIIGPNGAGKSTFFKLIIGFHSPNAGTILYKGKNIEKLKLHERINLGMGVKFQAPSIFSELTVLQNLSLANNRNDSLKINDLLNDFSLEKEKNNLAGDLSHGKKQWLDIALSTISKPDLVFLDEPTAGLSVDETRLTGEIVKNLNKQGITFVVVGHDMDFVKQTASKVSLLHLGKMFIEGSVDQVLSDKGVNDIYLGLS